MGCNNKILMTAITFVCGGALFTFISSSTNYWKWLTNLNIDAFFYTGLYNLCYDKDGESKCESIETPEDYVYACRSLIAVTVVMGIIAVILSFIHLYKVTQRRASKVMVTIIVSLCSIGVILLVTANIVFGILYLDDEHLHDQWGLDLWAKDWTLGTSFYLNIVAALGLLVGAILMSKSYSPEQVQPQTGFVATTQQVGHFGQPVPPAYGQPTTAPYQGGQFAAYGQPVTNPYGQYAYSNGQQPAQPPPYSQPGPYSGQPQPYTTATSGQPMGMPLQSNTDTKPPQGDPAYPPPPPAQY